MTQKKRPKQHGKPGGAAAPQRSRDDEARPGAEASAPASAATDSSSGDVGGRVSGSPKRGESSPPKRGESSSPKRGESSPPKREQSSPLKREQSAKEEESPRGKQAGRETVSASGALDAKAAGAAHARTHARPPSAESKPAEAKARDARSKAQPGPRAGGVKPADRNARGRDEANVVQGQAGGETMVPPARRSRQLRDTPAQDAAAGSESPEPRDDQIWTEDVPAPAAMLGHPSSPPLALEELAAGQDAASALRLTRGSGGDRLREAAAFGGAQSLLSTDYYFRQYGAHGLRSLAAEVDDFGFDPHVDEKARPLLEALCKRYFRVDVVGAEHVPEHGRALLVANRSGALPWDGLVLRTALRAKRPELATLRWLSEDSVIHYPFMGVLMNRLGAVRACPENAERLLVQSRLVAVFPEGAQGSRKLFRDRYRLQRFGRGGYVKLALKFGVPILPTAIIGGEETNPVLGRSRLLGRFVGSESVPLTPTFPWLGPAGLMPAPVKWRIVIGEPIDLSAHGAAAADDALVVHRLNEQVRSSLQALVDQGKRGRGGVLFG